MKSNSFPRRESYDVWENEMRKLVRAYDERGLANEFVLKLVGASPLEAAGFCLLSKDDRFELKRIYKLAACSRSVEPSQIPIHLERDIPFHSQAQLDRRPAWQERCVERTLEMLEARKGSAASKRRLRHLDALMGSLSLRLGRLGELKAEVVGLLDEARGIFGAIGSTR